MKNKKNAKVVTAMQINLRIWIVAIFFIVCVFGLIVYNLFVLQILDYETYRAKATSQQLSDTIVVPNRGTIYDANMKVLAKSSTVWTVSVSPNVVDDERVDVTATVLSEILDIKRQEIFDKLNKRESQYQIITKKIEKDVADRLRQAIIDNDLDGVYLTQDSKRYYPYGDFAAYVLGFTGGDNQGLEGVEFYYDDVLTGTPGRVLTAKNGWGLNMDYEYAARYPSSDGNSLVLTIDETLQHFLEKELDQAVKTNNVQQKGMGLIMNVKTGAILALDNKPSYDPNNPYLIVDEEIKATIDAMEAGDERSALQSEIRQQQWRNTIVSDQYEPGSVFKIVTASAALDTGKFSLNSSFYCSGSIKVADRTMRCAHTEGHGALSFAGALINSCNPSFIEIGTALGTETFYDYFNAFGMTEKTGIDLPGEASSSHYTPDKMGPVELASCSFGQSNKVTPIQMATAVAAAVNGGNLVQPHVVSKIIDANGNIIETVTPQPKRQVISEDVSKEICEILEQNVINGQGVNAYVAGYRVGGKSGTSQKLDKDGGSDARIASFVGIAPANDPEILVLIVLDEPQGTSAYGGQLCAPVISRVLNQTLPYLGIEPQYTEKELATIEAVVPNCVSLEMPGVQRLISERQFNIKIVGNGSTAVSQFPIGGTTMPKGSTVVIYTEAGLSPNVVTVPDLTGKTSSAASSLLEDIGLNVKRLGVPGNTSDIIVTMQDIEQGASVQEGTLVTITCQDKSVQDPLVGGL